MKCGEKAERPDDRCAVVDEHAIQAPVMYQFDLADQNWASEPSIHNGRALG